jgi:hypothetical protein
MRNKEEQKAYSKQQYQKQKERLERMKIEDPKGYEEYVQKRKDYKRNWFLKNHDRRLEYYRTYIKNHPEKRRQIQDNWNKKRVERNHYLKENDPEAYAEYLKRNREYSSKANLSPERWAAKRKRINEHRRKHKDEINKKRRERYAQLTTEEKRDYFKRSNDYKKLAHKRKVQEILNAPAKDYSEWKAALKKAGY